MMTEYEEVCSNIRNKEYRLKMLNKDIDDIQTDLNNLYQRQSELFSEMMVEEESE